MKYITAFALVQSAIAAGSPARPLEVFMFARQSNFPEQTARYLRITQTGASAKYHWSIYELDVFAAP